MKVNGHDCEVNAKVSVADLQELSGKKDDIVVGFAISYPRTIYVAHDSKDRDSTFLHEIIEQVFFILPEKLKKKLGKDREEYVIALEKGIHSAYKSYGHELPDPFYSDDKVKSDGRYL